MFLRHGLSLVARKQYFRRGQLCESADWCGSACRQTWSRFQRLIGRELIRLKWRLQFESRRFASACVASVATDLQSRLKIEWTRTCRTAAVTRFGSPACLVPARV